MGVGPSASFPSSATRSSLNRFNTSSGGAGGSGCAAESASAFALAASSGNRQLSTRVICRVAEAGKFHGGPATVVSRGGRLPEVVVFPRLRVGECPQVAVRCAAQLALDERKIRRARAQFGGEFRAAFQRGQLGGERCLVLRGEPGVKRGAASAAEAQPAGERIGVQSCRAVQVAAPGRRRRAQRLRLAAERFDAEPLPSDGPIGSAGSSHRHAVTQPERIVKGDGAAERAEMFDPLDRVDVI